jgi:hypothetical protein
MMQPQKQVQQRTKQQQQQWVSAWRVCMGCVGGKCGHSGVSWQQQVQQQGQVQQQRSMHGVASRQTTDVLLLQNCLHCITLGVADQSEIVKRILRAGTHLCCFRGI